MNDHEIVALFFARQEKAISATADKYGRYCHAVAYNILFNRSDAEECVNDTYLGAWNSIPPQRPNHLAAYLGKITRNLALNRYKRNSVAKRGSGQVELALSELENCIPDNTDVERAAEDSLIASVINRFLYAHSLKTRNIFIRRYWYLCSIQDIAESYGMTESNVKVLLFRMRNELKKQLEREGIYLRERLLNVIGQIDDRLVAGADPQARVRQKRIRHQWIAALAACLVLALGIGIVAPIALGNREAGKVTMEINPGVEYTITENGKVSAVRFLNEDAKEVLGEASLKGEHLKSAISLTLAAYKIGGYMERNDTVLISFDRRLSENGRLKESVEKDVRQVLEAETAVHTLVYVSESDGADAAAIAEKYGISQGKAKLVGDAAKNSELSEEALAKLPLDELVGLQKELDSVVIDTRYIGLSKAKAIALSDAGCTLVRVTFTEARLIDEGNRYPYYSLVFSDGQTQWNYSINAINGDILAKNETTLLLSLGEARAIALKDAGIDGSLPEEKVVFTKEELSRNQGRPCWVLEFYTAKYQYSYKIDAKTGEIIYFEYHIDILKAKEIALNDAGCGEYAVFTEEKLVSGGIKTPYYLFVFNDGRTQWTYRIDAVLGMILDKNAESLLVPLEKAKEIALADAGITDAERPVFTKEVLSRNQGRPCWVLEFYTAKYQYVYKIDVRTGEIIYNRRYIYMEVARETARADSGCSAEARIEYTVEELIDGGIKTPYYRFVFNDGRTQWTYRIDATNGGILAKAQEPMPV